MAPAVTQVWRDGPRQARLARLLPLIDVRATDLPEAKIAGELLATSGTSDAVDALVAGLVRPGDQILTSDPKDLEQLASALAFPVTVVPV